MSSLLIVWRILLEVSLFVFPQLLGILLYFRLRWAPRWITSIVAALAPAFVFFWLARIILMAGLREYYARDHSGCGMPALGAAILLLAGTVFHVVLGGIVQGVLLARRRRTVAG